MKRKRGAPKALADVENAVVIVPAEPEKPEPEPEDPAAAEWNAFAQDHYELVEQLPLSLHRSFSLIRELDDLVQDNTSRIVPAARTYINLRESMLCKPKRAPSGLDLLAHVSAAVEPPLPPPPQPQVNPVPNLASTPPPVSAPAPVPTGDPTIPTPDLGPSTTTTTNLAPAHPALIPLLPPQLPTDSRALLTLIATLASDAVRASNEKVGIANSVYQTVDNHLKTLDALIAQHVSTLPREPDPEPEPELEPPSPTYSHPEEERETIPPLRITRTGTTPTTIRIRNRSASKSKVQTAAAADENGGSSPSRKPKSVTMAGSSSSKGSSRAPAQVTSASTQPKTTATPARRNRPPPRNKKATEADDQPDDRRYCYCDQVSFGEMVACDGECKREWFHLPCVGLQKAPGPDTKWYCKDCQTARNPKKRQRRS